MPKGQHAIRFVAQKTGLSPHVIRVWERRYGAVAPQRSGTNRRLYTDAELDRLLLLAQASRCGHNIGTIAGLPEERLRVLAADCLQTRKCTEQDPDGFVATALDAVKALDTAGLETVLNRAAVAVGNQGVLCRVIAPLACALGTGWKAGEITAAQEHFATAVIRVFLSKMRPHSVTENTPRLVVATPSGQVHELGALLVAAAAGNVGWQVTYLGAALPAVEIAGAAIQTRARAVALSVVYPEDDQYLPDEVLRLRQLLPAGMALLLGGRAVAAYRPALKSAPITFIEALADLYEALDEARAPRPSPRIELADTRPRA
ncbi:MAG: MerR family transcriptional regulator [Proteobacteria bacterium]|nr:MerR family transcriptional regulator [Pseudomonadota bacterium]